MMEARRLDHSDVVMGALSHVWAPWTSPAPSLSALQARPWAVTAPKCSLPFKSAHSSLSRLG